MPRWLMPAVFAAGALIGAGSARCAPSLPGANDAFDRAYRDFARHFHDEMQRSGIVGGSFYLVRGDQVIAREFHGQMDAQRQQPVDENTIYHWASVTKTFTAIAIMQLRDRGLLQLDDAVVAYVPELKAVHNPYGDMRAVTIRQLLSHSAGFRNPTWTWRDDDKPWQPFEPQRWEQLVAMMPYTELLFAPGSRYSYSNPGVLYLGRIIETVSGESYETYIDKHIFKPLEMHRSYFDSTPPHLLPFRSHSYYIEGGKRTAARFDADTGITVSNGGLNSPLPDMVRYVAFLIGDLTGDGQRTSRYDVVLKRASLEEMWQPQRIAGDYTQGWMRPQTGVGLGFFVDDIDGRRYVGHNGDQNGFRAFVSICPQTGVASLLALNSETRPTTNDPANLRSAETRIALNILPLLQSLPE